MRIERTDVTRRLLAGNISATACLCKSIGIVEQAEQPADVLSVMSDGGRDRADVTPFGEFRRLRTEQRRVYMSGASALIAPMHILASNRGISGE
jgi:hypothetical protein